MSGFGGALIKGAGTEADKQGKGVGKRFGTALNIGVAAIATGAVAAGTALYMIGETFDEVRDTIRAGTGATGKDLDDLVDSAKAVGSVVPAEFEDIGTAVADVDTRLGLTGPTLEKFSAQMLEAGRLMGEDLDINKLSQAFNVFKIEGEDTTEAMDHLFRVSQATGVGMNELAANTAASAPAVQSLGFSFEETAALVGNLDKAGLNSSKMMAGMSRALVELAKDGEEPADAFERVTGEIQGFLEEGDKASAIDLASQLFGTRNASQFIGALESGALAMDDLGSVAGMTEDTILGAGQETMDFAEHWQLFKNEIMTELAPAAEWLFDKISDGMSWIKDNAIPVVKDLAHWLGENSGWLTPLAATIGGIIAAIKIWSMVQGVLNAVMAANPIGLIVLAIVGLVAAFVTAYKRSEKFRAVVDAVWQGVKDAVSVVWDFLKTKVFQPLVNWIKRMWERFQTFKERTTDAWDSVKTALKAGWDWIKSKVIDRFILGFKVLQDAVKKRIDKVKEIWATIKIAFRLVKEWVQRNVFDRFKQGVQNLRDNISNVVGRIKNIWSGIKSAFKALWDWVKTNVFGRFKDGLKNLRNNVRTMADSMGNAWRTIANKFRNPINWVLDKVWNNGIAKAFNNAAKALKLKTRLSTEAQIPAFAKGGLAKKGWALVGEEGPELVNFDQPGRVYTAQETADALSLTRPGDEKATDSLPAMGGGLASRAWEGVKSAAGAVTGWVRGGLAKAADLLLSPIRKIIAPTVSKWGTFGQFAGGAMTSSIDSLVKWIRGKDDVGDAGGIQADISGGKWRRPSRGRVTSGYGPRSLMGMGFHAGVDYAGGPYTYAAAAGKVYRTGWNILSGRTGIGIGIDHGGGVFTYYGHNPSMAAVKVRPGDMVRAGQHIGREGATGRVTGPHLHFETHRGGWGRHVNPRSFGIFDRGGWLEPGMLAYHSARMSKPDAVLTARQWDAMHRLADRAAVVSLSNRDVARLAEAVRMGAREGSEIGSRDGVGRVSRASLSGAGQNVGW